MKMQSCVHDDIIGWESQNEGGTLITDAPRNPQAENSHIDEYWRWTVDENAARGLKGEEACTVFLQLPAVYRGVFPGLAEMCECQSTFVLNYLISDAGEPFHVRVCSSKTHIPAR